MQLRSVLSTVVLAAATAGCAADPPDAAPRTVTADGEVIDGAGAPAEPAPARVIRALTLPNGNVVTFSQHADGGMEVLERGAANTNAVGSVPQLAAASPYEIFTAIAPRDAAVPPELVADQAAIVAGRVLRGETSTAPAGFRVDDNPRFYARNPARAFNACTDVAGWESTGDTLGANCPTSGTFAYNQCVASYLPPELESCAGTSCTEYFVSGYHQTRASVCARTGDGVANFAMGLRDHGPGNYTSWFDHPMTTGAYYIHWYSHATQAKDFWRLVYHTGAGTRRLNKSWWLKS